MKIYACQPTYGSISKDSKRQFWFSATDPRNKLEVYWSDFGSSLLPDCFNAHWVNALNLQRDGKEIERFVMLHADVVPEDHWLDKLLEEFDKFDCGLMSVVVPLGDGRALTSTAVGDGSDQWAASRRLTMKELQRFPATFDITEVERRLNGLLPPNPILLVNTGCWVCDFTESWRFKVCFRMPTRIIHSQGGPSMNQVVSEDWDFSRQLENLGVEVMATKAVKLSHDKIFHYGNDESVCHHWWSGGCEEDDTFFRDLEQENCYPIQPSAEAVSASSSADG